MSLVGNQNFERLSDEQKRLVTTVDGLASVNGDDTKDVVRSGRVELWPGCTVIDAVIDASAPGIDEPDPDNLLYGLDVVTVGPQTEEMTVSLRDGTTAQVVDENEIYGDDPAPDYAIKSFLIDILPTSYLQCRVKLHSS